MVFERAGILDINPLSSTAAADVAAPCASVPGARLSSGQVCAQLSIAELFGASCRIATLSQYGDLIFAHATSCPGTSNLLPVSRSGDESERL